MRFTKDNLTNRIIINVNDLDDYDIDFDNEIDTQSEFNNEFDNSSFDENIKCELTENEKVDVDNFFNFFKNNDEKIHGKHFQQMTSEERLYLMRIKDNLLKRNVIHFTQHALERMEERYIKERDIIRAIKNGQIIEYRENNNNKVITIRGCTLTRKKENIYVILSITDGSVITTYSNKNWSLLAKEYNLDKYISNFKINIPEYFKKQYSFYYSF